MSSRLFIDQKAILFINHPPYSYLLQKYIVASKEREFFFPSLVPHTPWPGSINEKTRYNYLIINRVRGQVEETWQERGE